MAAEVSATQSWRLLAVASTQVDHCEKAHHASPGDHQHVMEGMSIVAGVSRGYAAVHPAQDRIAVLIRLRQVAAGCV